MPTNRAGLKTYFKKNSIPTEGQFAELIDGMLNQADDGLLKLAGQPLRINATGDTVSEKKTLTIYRSSTEQNPDWTLSLNPRSVASDPATARLGLSISDGVGSRLFINSEKGNIGIGTTEPKELLQIGEMIAFHNGGDKALAFNGYYDDAKGGWMRFKDTVQRNGNQIKAGLGLVYWDAVNNALSLRATSDSDFVNNVATVDKLKALTIWSDGKVGIGTDSPGAKLEVKGGVTILEQESWQPMDPLQNGWQVYDQTYNPPGFFKDSQGIVHLRGLIKAWAGLTTFGFDDNGLIFTLPAGYHPPMRQLHIVSEAITLPGGASNISGFGRVDIQPNGRIVCPTYTNDWLCLDSISFRVSDPVQAGILPLPLEGVIIPLP